MKQYYYVTFIILVSVLPTFAQPSAPFTCPGIQVIAYKAGTNCTASPYRYFTIDLAGTQSALPFYTLTNTSKEVNGLGLNGADGFLYGIEYDRANVGATCSFSNFHLMRYDALGIKVDLGILPVPPGGILQQSVGCVTREGNYIYSVVDGSGNRYIAEIVNITALPASPGTLTGNFKQIVNNCSIASYADWAVNPQNDKLYAYGIYNNGGVSTGTVLEIDPVAATVTCVGSANTTVFLDPVRDNFGGVYFAPNGFLYGININTRRLYSIDVTNGNINHISTMSGSGQIRADMGSCTNGSLILPVHFKSTSLKAANNSLFISWEMGEAENLSHFIIEAGKSSEFSTIKTITAQPNKLKYDLSITSSSITQYRIKAVFKSGTFLYSPVLTASPRKETSIRLVNPVFNGMVELVIPANTSSSSYRILNSSGITVKQGRLAKSSFFTISIKTLKPGNYFLSFDGTQGSLSFIIM